VDRQRAQERKELAANAEAVKIRMVGRVISASQAVGLAMQYILPGRHRAYSII